MMLLFPNLLRGTPEVNITSTFPMQLRLSYCARLVRRMIHGNKMCLPDAKCESRSDVVLDERMEV